MQDQTSNSSQQESSDEGHGAPQRDVPDQDADSTWGLGAASALDSLRRQNYRGRRPQQGEDKPTSH